MGSTDGRDELESGARQKIGETVAEVADELKIEDTAVPETQIKFQDGAGCALELAERQYAQGEILNALNIDELFELLMEVRAIKSVANRIDKLHS